MVRGPGDPLNNSHKISDRRAGDRESHRKYNIMTLLAPQRASAWFVDNKPTNNQKANPVELYVFFSGFSGVGIGLYVFFRILGPDALDCMFFIRISVVRHKCYSNFPLYATNFIRISVVRHKFSWR